MRNNIWRVVFGLSLAVALAGQQAEPQQIDRQTLMMRLADATTRLAKAVDASDRSAYQAPLDALEASLPKLRSLAGSLSDPARARRSVDALARAIVDLRHPVGDGRASDPWDLVQLRRACTMCHVGHRSLNRERGLFPNVGGVVAGTIALRDRGGSQLQQSGGVVVFLEQPGERASARPRPASISQRGRRFDPAVLVIERGTTVSFPNDDVVFHNVFSLSRGNAFDLGTYAKGRQEQRTFESAGLVKVHCNIHSDMAAHILVLESAHHAVSDDEGRWLITNVPPGTYTLRVWHALAKEQRRSIQVDADQLLEVPLEIRESKTRLQHPNKHGRRYRRKY